MSHSTSQSDVPIDTARLQRWGLAHSPRAATNLAELAQAGITADLWGTLDKQLTAILPRLGDADAVFNQFTRFVSATRSPLGLAALFERDPNALPALLQMFAAGPYLSELLISDPESYDLLRLTEGEPVARDVLAHEIQAELVTLTDPRAVLSLLRRYKRRETLRIAYGDLIRGLRLEAVTRQISYLAEALIEAALFTARRELIRKFGEPRDRHGAPCRFVILALGKLGGLELNYSSDIDLIMLYESDGQTDRPRGLANSEFFTRLAREVVRLLTESTDLGIVYRVDLRLRPGGESGPLVMSLPAALQYYDVLGRTWERQAFVKARPAAGDLELGTALLQQLEPWIYRRYLTRADIGGIRALKRRIEQQVKQAGGETTNLKTGRGGIRDIEFVIQFLQLLNGGDLPTVRTTNTLVAIQRLENAGCLTNTERVLLEEHYTWLRRVEHRLQISHDLQTHDLPKQPHELQQLAIGLNYGRLDPKQAAREFLADYQRASELNRKMLDHLLHEAFPDEQTSEPEIDLILDPAPTAEIINQVLGRYQFRDVPSAYRLLQELGQERVRFLSPRRCRHFLAAIAPRLLAAISTTADPDATLRNLVRVTDSLGGKAVLWELFQFNPPTLALCVEICASSPFLCDILTQQPGMIDELLDSLLVDQLPSAVELRTNLEELLRGARDPLPILHGFMSANKLRIGVRDLLNKEPVQAINAALSQTAETIIAETAAWHAAALNEKFGAPLAADTGEPAGGVIVALGKFGGAELNYHSDLDLIFLYSADGMTFHRRRSTRSAEVTSNLHYFSELAQRIVKTAGQIGPQGKLYEIDSRLRPTGKSGRLATSFPEFQRYFETGQGQLWERQALCRARIITGDETLRARALEVIHRAQYAVPWRTESAREIFDMRLRMQEGASELNLKRGVGGVLDIEFLVQLLQLKHGRDLPDIRRPNTLDALDALHAHQLLNDADWDYLTTSYQVLRSIQGRLRLMNMTALNDLPSLPDQQQKLAALLGYPDYDKLLRDCRELQRENRIRLTRFVDNDR